jgi:hypothetical protein
MYSLPSTWTDYTIINVIISAFSVNFCLYREKILQNFPDGQNDTRKF